jgi:RNA polymerase sigma-70 factor (ECF subfamily)
MSAAAARAAAPVVTDGVLFARIAGGDLGALGAIFDRHHAKVRAFLMRSAQTADVDDLVQETFLTASRAAGTYDGRDDARPFLIGVAAQLVRRKRRTFARLRAALSRWGSEQAAPPATPEEDATAASEAARVRAAVARLDDDRRLALVLVEWEGLSGEDAARALGVPVGTLYRRVHEARGAVRKALGRGGRA